MSAHFNLTSVKLFELNQVSNLIYRCDFDDLQTAEQRATVVNIAISDSNAYSADALLEYVERIARALEGK